MSRGGLSAEQRSRFPWVEFVLACIAGAVVGLPLALFYVALEVGRGSIALLAALFVTAREARHLRDRRVRRAVSRLPILSTAGPRTDPPQSACMRLWRGSLTRLEQLGTPEAVEGLRGLAPPARAGGSEGIRRARAG